MPKKTHKDGDTVIERNQTTGEGTITVMEGADTVCESGHNAPQTEAETMTDGEKAGSAEQTVNQILEKLRAMTPDPQRTKDGKYTLGKMLDIDDPFCFREAEEADTGKAVRLMMPSPHRTGGFEQDAWMQTKMKTESRASRCAYDSCIEDGKNQIPVLRWLSPEDAAKETRLSYLVSYQDRGMDFYAWKDRHPPMSEADAVRLTIELLSALEGLHSGRYSHYMGQGETGKPFRLIKDPPATAYEEGLHSTGKPVVHRLVDPENIRIVQNNDKDTPHLLLTGFYDAAPAGYVDRSIDPVDFPPPCSPYFACREQLLGKPPRQAWDVWGAAACLYYFLTGETVRRPGKGAALFNAPIIPINEQGRPIRTPHLAGIIDGALNDRNGLKYETAQELKAALSGCIAPDGSD